MAGFLFFLFAGATVLQFNRLSNEKIYQARLDTFQSDERAYDAAIDAHHTCVMSIETRETYRSIFAGIAQLFRTSADLPVALFPNSIEAINYQAALKDGVNILLDQPVKDNLPSREMSDCPLLPEAKPIKPER